MEYLGGQMKAVGVAVLYTALGLVANVGAAEVADLRDGDMRKLNFHEMPVAVSQTPFEADGGGEMTLGEHAGKVVVLNFWATWCAPCREEMPTLSALQAELGGEDFEVVTIATGRNDPVGMAQFFEEIGVDNLPLHRDPRQLLARDMGVLGLPITVILDRDGMEIARLQGDADWSSESAMAIVAALIAE
jgi:thiol-disulfide isomerase/thioredoxin